MIVTAKPAPSGPAVPTRPAGRLPGRLRAARALAIVLGTVNALGAVGVAVTQSEEAYELALGALIFAVAVTWLPVAVRLAPGRPRPARVALGLAAVGVVHAVLDVVLVGWYSSAVFGAVCIAIAALVAPYARGDR